MGGPDRDRLRARYDELVAAWRSHDLAAVQAMHAADVVLEIGGRHRFAGRYTGVGAVLAALVKLAPYVTAAMPRPDEIEERGNEVEVSSTIRVRSAGDDRERITIFRTTLRFDERRLIVWIYNRADDEDALDAFFDMIDHERERY